MEVTVNRLTEIEEQEIIGENDIVGTLFLALTAEIFHLFTLNENKFFETNHSNFEFKSKMPRAMTYAHACHREIC